MMRITGLAVIAVTQDTVTLQWDVSDARSLVGYNVYWSDCDTETTEYVLLDSNSRNCYKDDTCTISANDLDCSDGTVTFTVQMYAYYRRYFKVAPVSANGVGDKSDAVMAQIDPADRCRVRMEKLNRGLTATQISGTQVYLSWRLLAEDGLDPGGDGYADAYTATGLSGYNFHVYRNRERIATVTDSTNYIDDAFDGELTEETYVIVPVNGAEELWDEACTSAHIFTFDSENVNVAYKDIPLRKPADTTIRETYGVDTIALGGYIRTDSGYISADDVITYSANDMAVADVDGDGEYEYLVKWDPSRSKDVSQQGYTGKAYLDCYKLDGTLLWRLDLGINIRAGAHYTEFGFYDFDYDGRAELIVKTAPGTQMTIYGLDENGKNRTDENGDLVVSEKYYVTNTGSAVQAYGDSDMLDTASFVASADDYREYLIETFMDWGVWERYSEKTVASAVEGHWSDNLVALFTTSADWSDSIFYTGEVKSEANVTLDMTTATVEEIRRYIPDYEKEDLLVNVALYDESGKLQYVSGSSGAYPVLKTVKLEEVSNYYGGYDLASVNHDGGYTREEAQILAGYFLNHYQYRMKKHNLNTWEGYVVTGPEYISLFGGDGTELDTIDWYYGREDDGLLWGDYAMNYIEPGNRVDRFNVALAYLDGKRASCIMGRGYYTRTTMVAYNVVDGKLTVTGTIDSGWTVMTNPFNDSPHGYDGCDEKNGTLAGQGDHYIAVADVDGDGCQEIINGGAIVSYKNGDLYLYSSGGDYLEASTGNIWAKYGHGDAIHVADVDPDHPGLEIVSCFEGGACAPYDWAMRDARSNVALFGEPGTTDYGRIIIGDVRSDVRGLELSPGYDAKGNRVTLYEGLSTNMNIKWAADMTTQFVSGTADTGETTITGCVNQASHTFLRAPGYLTNNGTKGNPCLVADLFGDSREEIILRKSDSTSLRIYMNIEVSGHKNYTLMQNAQYRVGIASQNSTYNQPAYTDYYYASDTDWSRVMIPTIAAEEKLQPYPHA